MRNKTNPIGLDVLIIGGGVQGLWLLNELVQANYSAVLLERRELGGEQTCHSHVYIHRGYFYHDRAVPDLPQRLQAVNQQWDQWFTQHPPDRKPYSCFGYQDASRSQQVAALWQNPLQLTSKEIDVPPALLGGDIKSVRETTERWIDGEWLVRQLSEPVSSYIGGISHVERIGSHRNTTVPRAIRTIDEVEVSLRESSSKIVFKPRVLVLSAGLGNQKLLEEAAVGDRDIMKTAGGAQQLRKSHMLVVSGKRGELEPLVGVFPKLGSLFIVYREREDEVVWLISDDRGPYIAYHDEWREFDGHWWLPQVIAALKSLAPKYFSHPERLEWGLYDAPKAERKVDGTLPHEPHVESFGFENLLAIWPTKLTLAPRASQIAMDRIQRAIPLGSKISGDWVNHRVAVGVAPEQWTYTPMLTWREFCELHRLSTTGGHKWTKTATI